VLLDVAPPLLFSAGRIPLLPLLPSFPPHEREEIAAGQDKKFVRGKHENIFSFKFTDTSHGNKLTARSMNGKT
jgi:hypothetical protein